MHQKSAQYNLIQNTKSTNKTTQLTKNIKFDQRCFYHSCKFSSSYKLHKTWKLTFHLAAFYFCTWRFYLKFLDTPLKPKGNKQEAEQLCIYAFYGNFTLQSIMEAPQSLFHVININNDGESVFLISQKVVYFRLNFFPHKLPTQWLFSASPLDFDWTGFFSRYPLQHAICGLNTVALLRGLSLNTLDDSQVYSLQFHEK